MCIYNVLVRTRVCSTELENKKTKRLSRFASLRSRLLSKSESEQEQSTSNTVKRSNGDQGASVSISASSSSASDSLCSQPIVHRKQVVVSTVVNSSESTRRDPMQRRCDSLRSRLQQWTSNRWNSVFATRRKSSASAAEDYQSGGSVFSSDGSDLFGSSQSQAALRSRSQDASSRLPHSQHKRFVFTAGI